MPDTPTTDRPPIHITAYRRGGHIGRIEMSLPARGWMGGSVIGLEPATALRQLGEQASHSPRAHTRALALACQAAAGEHAPSRDAWFAIERELAAEAVDTHLRRLLIDWPQQFGFDARHNRFAEFHRRLITPHGAEAAFALGGEVLDLVARELLAGFFNQIRMPHGIGEFIERVNAGGSLGSIMAELIALGASGPPCGAAVPLLGTLSAAAWATAVGGWPSAEFVARPTYAGEPAETGPLARHAASPLVRLLLDRGHRVSARLLAKAIEVADCASRMRYPFTDDVPALLDATAAGAGAGLARVETARGVLLCWVRLAEGVIADCAIIPAGAWNLHPDGVFYREAMSPGNGSEDHAAALQRLSVLALALDPSLPHVIEVVDESSAEPGSGTALSPPDAGRHR
ncbi:hypothetical protein [Thauera aromatica]|uniref:Uncharacterized protein n=1 Tax=Thauera aromatica K172 TaxID=44139 RepID=A0A2R4BSJ1_THAAR|nr:hypothetical protein [Thauera aromatica]AVR90172.1 hypothetical protein Tharo_3291 [Thauera aromatica K172]